MRINRSSGILMHVSSLPNRFGIGGYGREAFEWIDFLAQTGTKYWQILPLNPTGFANSPYQGLSAYAGNPYFIDPFNLYDLGLISKPDLDAIEIKPTVEIDFKQAFNKKNAMLQSAFRKFYTNKQTNLFEEFTDFKESNQYWLPGYSLFMTFRAKFTMASWKTWPDKYRIFEQANIDSLSGELQNDLDYFSFLQYISERQWKAVKSYANRVGISIIGDLPIFVGYESADVWEHPHLFQLDNQLFPTFVAGVPPDAFSDTGQLWGNPLYAWEKQDSENYTWWIHRIKKMLENVDLIRLDHFRGFAGYFRIPAGDKSAVNGSWHPGPGINLFEAIERSIGDLPFIAEDLGVITEDVTNLREQLNLPGMRVLQFAFGGKQDNQYLPHNYPNNCVAYTGTHDNNTSIGWFRHMAEKEKTFCTNYLGGHVNDIAYEMIRTIWRSAAAITIAPMQDFLRLDEDSRMNKPGTIDGNWSWRMKNNYLSTNLAYEISIMNETFSR